MKSKLAVILSCTVYLYLVLIFQVWKQQGVLSWDKSGYYLYLPATFIYHDLGQLKFYPKITDKYHLNGNFQYYGVYDVPTTGRKINKYPAGISIMQSPFFLFIHAFELITHQYDADGYSAPYMNAMVISTLIWVLIGFIYLRKFLLKYFSDLIVALTILLIVFATNLYSYTVFDPGMSHPYSFSLFAILLYVMHQWFETGKKGFAYLLGIILGLIFIVRPTNVIVFIVPALWIYTLNGNKTALPQFLRKNLQQISIAFILFLAVISIQFAYWHYTTGHLLFYSYEGEYFDFLSPKIWKGLFSYRKGWFVYTPVAFLGIVGIIPLWFKNKNMAKIVFAFFAINIYIIFSWSQWYYGGGFGARPLIDSLPVLAIPLAALVEAALAIRTIYVKQILFQVFMFVIILNLFQAYQFNHDGIIPYDHNNRAYYWKSFFKMHTSEEDRKLIHFNED